MYTTAKGPRPPADPKVSSGVGSGAASALSLKSLLANTTKRSISTSRPTVAGGSSPRSATTASSSTGYGHSSSSAGAVSRPKAGTNSPRNPYTQSNFFKNGAQQQQSTANRNNRSSSNSNGVNGGAAARSSSSVLVVGASSSTANSPVAESLRRKLLQMQQQQTAGSSSDAPLVQQQEGGSEEVGDEVDAAASDHGDNDDDGDDEDGPVASDGDADAREDPAVDPSTPTAPRQQPHSAAGAATPHTPKAPTGAKPGASRGGNSIAAAPNTAKKPLVVTSSSSRAVKGTARDDNRLVALFMEIGARGIHQQQQHQQSTASGSGGGSGGDATNKNSGSPHEKERKRFASLSDVKHSLTIPVEAFLERAPKATGIPKDRLEAALCDVLEAKEDGIDDADEEQMDAIPKSPNRRVGFDASLPALDLPDRHGGGALDEESNEDNREGERRRRASQPFKEAPKGTVDIRTFTSVLDRCEQLRAEANERREERRAQTYAKAYDYAAGKGTSRSMVGATVASGEGKGATAYRQPTTTVAEEEERRAGMEGNNGNGLNRSHSGAAKKAQQPSQQHTPHTAQQPAYDPAKPSLHAIERTSEMGKHVRAMRQRDDEERTAMEEARRSNAHRQQGAEEEGDERQLANSSEDVYNSNPNSFHSGSRPMSPPSAPSCSSNRLQRPHSSHTPSSTRPQSPTGNNNGITSDLAFVALKGLDKIANSRRQKEKAAAANGDDGQQQQQPTRPSSSRPSTGNANMRAHHRAGQQQRGHSPSDGRAQSENTANRRVGNGNAIASSDPLCATTGEMDLRSARSGGGGASNQHNFASTYNGVSASPIVPRPPVATRHDNFMVSLSPTAASSSSPRSKRHSAYQNNPKIAALVANNAKLYNQSTAYYTSASGGSGGAHGAISSPAGSRLRPKKESRRLYLATNADALEDIEEAHEVPSSCANPMFQQQLSRYTASLNNSAGGGDSAANKKSSQQQQQQQIYVLPTNLRDLLTFGQGHPNITLSALRVVQAFLQSRRSQCIAQVLRKMRLEKDILNHWRAQQQQHENGINGSGANGTYFGASFGGSGHQQKFPWMAPHPPPPSLKVAMQLSAEALMEQSEADARQSQSIRQATLQSTLAGANASSSYANTNNANGAGMGGGASEGIMADVSISGDGGAPQHRNSMVSQATTSQATSPRQQQQQQYRTPTSHLYHYYQWRSYNAPTQSLEQQLLNPNHMSPVERRKQLLIKKEKAATTIYCFLTQAVAAWRRSKRQQMVAKALKTQEQIHRIRDIQSFVHGKIGMIAVQAKITAIIRNAAAIVIQKHVKSKIIAKNAVMRAQALVEAGIQARMAFEAKERKIALIQGLARGKHAQKVVAKRQYRVDKALRKEDERQERLHYKGVLRRFAQMCVCKWYVIRQKRLVAAHNEARVEAEVDDTAWRNEATLKLQRFFRMAVCKSRAASLKAAVDASIEAGEARDSSAVVFQKFCRRGNAQRAVGRLAAAAAAEREAQIAEEEALGEDYVVPPAASSSAASLAAKSRVSSVTPSTTAQGQQQQPTSRALSEVQPSATAADHDETAAKDGEDAAAEAADEHRLEQPHEEVAAVPLKDGLSRRSVSFAPAAADGKKGDGSVEDEKGVSFAAEADHHADEVGGSESASHHRLDSATNNDETIVTQATPTEHSAAIMAPATAADPSAGGDEESNAPQPIVEGSRVERRLSNSVASSVATVENGAITASTQQAEGTAGAEGASPPAADVSEAAADSPTVEAINDDSINRARAAVVFQKYCRSGNAKRRVVAMQASVQRQIDADIARDEDVQHHAGGNDDDETAAVAIPAVDKHEPQSEEVQQQQPAATTEDAQPEATPDASPSAPPAEPTQVVGVAEEEEAPRELLPPADTQHGDQSRAAVVFQKYCRSGNAKRRVAALQSAHVLLADERQRAEEVGGDNNGNDLNGGDGTPEGHVSHADGNEAVDVGAASKDEATAHKIEANEEDEQQAVASDSVVAEEPQWHADDAKVEEPAAVPEAATADSKAAVADDAPAAKEETGNKDPSEAAEMDAPTAAAPRDSEDEASVTPQETDAVSPPTIDVKSPEARQTIAEAVSEVIDAVVARSDVPLGAPSAASTPATADVDKRQEVVVAAAAIPPPPAPTTTVSAVVPTVAPTTTAPSPPSPAAAALASQSSTAYLLRAAAGSKRSLKASAAAEELEEGEGREEQKKKGGEEEEPSPRLVSQPSTTDYLGGFGGSSKRSLKLNETSPLEEDEEHEGGAMGVPHRRSSEKAPRPTSGRRITSTAGSLLISQASTTDYLAAGGGSGTTPRRSQKDSSAPMEELEEAEGGVGPRRHSHNDDGVPYRVEEIRRSNAASPENNFNLTHVSTTDYLGGGGGSKRSLKASATPLEEAIEAVGRAVVGGHAVPSSAAPTSVGALDVGSSSVDGGAPHADAASGGADGDLHQRRPQSAGASVASRGALVSQASTTDYLLGSGSGSKKQSMRMGAAANPLEELEEEIEAIPLRDDEAVPAEDDEGTNAFDDAAEPDGGADFGILVTAPSTAVFAGSNGIAAKKKHMSVAAEIAAAAAASSSSKENSSSVPSSSARRAVAAAPQEMAEELEEER